MVAYFYADDGLVASPQPERLRRSFDILTDLFDWVDLHTTMCKMLSMACRSFHTPGRFSEALYERQVIGIGPSYR